MTVRTRVAPSPTGAPHIGTAYIALFNYAFARKEGGQFVLRIEDTDQVRSTRESEQEILDSLRWVGIPWDEGPDKGGAFGPYRQSERTDLYVKHCTELVTAGRAYPCFCTPERLQAVRAARIEAKDEFVGYDGHCAGLAPAEASRRVAAGESHVIRLRVPDDGDCVLEDRFRGEIRIPWGTVDDQVLLKADGFPTYHLANVVDDHLMEISHVIRGEEWISSTPKHLILYESFGWSPPQYAHLPLLRNPDKSKLSKRKNPTSILYYRQAGVLPETLVNYLGLMAYSPPDGDENFTLDQMSASFDLDRVSLGGPIFDLEKLVSFNGRRLREMTPEALYERLQSWMLNDDTWRRIVPLAQPRLDKLTDFVPMAGFLLADRLSYDPALLTAKFETGERAAELLRLAQWEMEKTSGWDADTVRGVFTRLSENEDLKLKALMPLFFVALCGSAVSLPIFESAAIMGRDMCLRRIQYALEALEVGGTVLKGKRLKALSADYGRRYGANA